MPATRDDLLRLAHPFAPDDIEWRVQTAGEKAGKPWARVLAYITNRAIMERLDHAVGPENWKNAFHEGPAGGVVCVLSIYVARDAGGEWVAKVDGAENTDVEPVKGGISAAMKRAAVQWGMGRYLYELEEGWAVVSETGRFRAKTKDGTWFKWDPPALPAWALPGGNGKPTGAPNAPVAAAPARVEGEQRRPPSPAPSPVSTSGAPNATAPAANGDVQCPKCGGATWDNRVGKKNPKAPDFKCRDRSCDGVVWPARSGNGAGAKGNFKQPVTAGAELPGEFEDFDQRPPNDDELPF